VSPPEMPEAPKAFVNVFQAPAALAEVPVFESLPSFLA